MIITDSWNWIITGGILFLVMWYSFGGKGLKNKGQTGSTEQKNSSVSKTKQKE